MFFAPGRDLKRFYVLFEAILEPRIVKKRLLEGIPKNIDFWDSFFSGFYQFGAFGGSQICGLLDQFSATFPVRGANFSDQEPFSTIVIIFNDFCTILHQKIKDFSCFVVVVVCLLFAENLLWTPRRLQNPCLHTLISKAEKPGVRRSSRSELQ